MRITTALVVLAFLTILGCDKKDSSGSSNSGVRPRQSAPTRNECAGGEPIRGDLVQWKVAHPAIAPDHAGRIGETDPEVSGFRREGAGAGERASRRQGDDRDVVFGRRHGHGGTATEPGRDAGARRPAAPDARPGRHPFPARATREIGAAPLPDFSKTPPTDSPATPAPAAPRLAPPAPKPTPPGDAGSGFLGTWGRGRVSQQTIQLASDGSAEFKWNGSVSTGYWTVAGTTAHVEFTRGPDGLPMAPGFSAFDVRLDTSGPQAVLHVKPRAGGVTESDFVRIQ